MLFMLVMHIIMSIITNNFLGLQHTTIFENGSAQCNMCGKTFGRKDNCVRHVTTVHLEDSKPETCDCSVCGKIFKNLQSLKTHMRVVHSIYSTK